MKSPFHLRRAVLLAAPLFLLSACESSTGGEVEVYTLASVRGIPLPVPFASSILPPPYLMVTEGTLTLRGDGTGSTRTTLRCPTPLPAGTECVEGPPQEVPLTYSREDESVRFSGAQYTATFGDDAVTIYYPEPYEYRR